MLRTLIFNSKFLTIVPIELFLIIKVSLFRNIQPIKLFKWKLSLSKISFNGLYRF